MCIIASWVEAQQRIKQFGASLPETRFLHVRAEDVLDGTRGTLRRIASWLGVRTDDKALAAMEHPEASPFAHGVAEDLGVNGADPGFLQDPRPRRVALEAGLERPTDWVAHDALWEEAVCVARELGYR
jgi:hypothetical protein